MFDFSFAAGHDTLRRRCGRHSDAPSARAAAGKADRLLRLLLLPALGDHGAGPAMPDVVNLGFGGGTNLSGRHYMERLLSGPIGSSSISGKMISPMTGLPGFRHSTILKRLWATFANGFRRLRYSFCRPSKVRHAGSMPTRSIIATALCPTGAAIRAKRHLSMCPRFCWPKWQAHKPLLPARFYSSECGWLRAVDRYPGPRTERRRCVRRSTGLPPPFEHLDDDHAPATAGAWRPEGNRARSSGVARCQGRRSRAGALPQRPRRADDPSGLRICPRQARPQSGQDLCIAARSQRLSASASA